MNTTSSDAAGGGEVGASRAGLAAKFQAAWPALLVLVVAVVRQAAGSLVGDVSWLITVSEGVLDGKTPYVDFLETNPPAAIFIYLPATAAAHLLGAAPEFMAAMFCFIAIGASLAFSGLILRRAELTQDIGPIAFAGVLAVLAVLPAHDFAQREHIAVILGLPFFSVLAARAGGAQIDAWLSIVAGLGAGLMASIKPHFGLMIVAALPYVARRVGWRTTAGSPELYAAAALFALHGAAIFLFFPAYTHSIAPLVLTTYLPIHYSWLALASGTAFASWAVLGAYLIIAAHDKTNHPLVATPALASCGGMLAYFIQGKAWSYQSYPAIALMAIALLMATPRSGPSLRRVAPGAICLALILSTEVVAPQTRLVFASLMAPVGAVAIVAALFGGGAAGRAGQRAKISTAAIGLVAAILTTWFDQRDTPFRFEKAAAGLAPHPKVVAITDDLNVGFPFVRRIGGVWAQRTNMLWITAGARARIRQSDGDPAVVAEMQPYLRLDRDILIGDIRRNQPDLILISDRLINFRDWVFDDPSTAAALAPYRLYDQDPARKTFLYVRNNLVAPLARLSATAPDTVGAQ